MSTPKIRFKGFEDDWEQRKLNEIADVRDGTHDSPKYVQEGHPFITSKNVSNGFINYDEVQYITDVDYEEINKRSKVDVHDILMGMIGTIGNLALIRQKPDFAIKNVALIKYTGDVDYQYLYQTLQVDCVTRQLFTGMDGGTQKFVSLKKIRELGIPFTEEQEQQKIGQYFENLDNLITLHQRKCDETKQLKKFMLQKMFPKNGEKNPEIRFEGFTDDWEQRKLDTVAKFSKGIGYSKGDLIETGTPIILYGRLYTKYETSISDVDTYVEAKEGSVYSKGGEVIVPASGETAEDIARAATVDKSGILLGGDLNVVMPNEDINSAFLAISISNGNSQRELAKKAQGKSVVHIHNKEIRNLIVPFPIKAEQNRIVDYFSTLDHLITLHQRKCEKLKELKKFMLQNMFV